MNDLKRAFASIEPAILDNKALSTLLDRLRPLSLLATHRHGTPAFLRFRAALKVAAQRILHDIHKQQSPDYAECTGLEPHETLFYLKECNQLARIGSLPDELIAMVFEEDLLDKQNAMRALALSHVCSRWRRIANHTPVLWSRISVNCSIDLLVLFVERSATKPIGLVIDSSQSSIETCQRQRLILEQPSTIDRMRRITTEVERPQRGGKLIETIFDHLSCCQLEELTCTLKGYAVCPHLLRLGRFPHLRYLTLRGRPPLQMDHGSQPLLPILVHLNTLTLIGLKLGKEELHALLKASPNLDTLVLDTIVFESRGAKSVVHASLKNLELIFHNHQAIPMHSWTVASPNLERIYISVPPDDGRRNTYHIQHVEGFRSAVRHESPSALHDTFQLFTNVYSPLRIL